MVYSQRLGIAGVLNYQYSFFTGGRNPVMIAFLAVIPGKYSWISIVVQQSNI